MPDAKKILVGKIVAPQAIRGEVRIQTYSDAPMDFKKFKKFVLALSRACEKAKKSILLTIARIA